MDVINTLDFAIVENKLFYKLFAMQQTYVQDEEQDNENYFTDGIF